MLTEIIDAIKEMKLPWAYAFFGEVPEPPYITLEFSYSNNFDADNRVFYRRDRYSVHLYTRHKDPLTESLLEKEFDDRELIWDKTETFLSDEELIQIIYTIFER